MTSRLHPAEEMLNGALARVCVCAGGQRSVEERHTDKPALKLMLHFILFTVQMFNCSKIFQN